MFNPKTNKIANRPKIHSKTISELNKIFRQDTKTKKLAPFLAT